MNCSAGSYVPGENIRTLLTTRKILLAAFSHDDCVCLCAASASSCNLCAGGKYSSKNGATFCASCNASQPYSLVDHQSCASLCSPGQSQANLTAMQCNFCPAGKYSAVAALSCENCPDGTAGYEGATQCGNCLAGDYANNKVCKGCGVGTYSLNGSNFCSFCGKFTTSAPRSSSCYQCSPGSGCSSCDPGYIPSTTTVNGKPQTCIPCDAGTYFPSYDATTCLSCSNLNESGVFADPGSTTCTECTTACPNANYYKSSACVPEHDLLCEQFQKELSQGSKIAMCLAPVIITIGVIGFLYLFLMLKVAGVKEVTVIYHLLTMNLHGSVLENTYDSTFAAFICMTTHGVDHFTNFMTLVLLSPSAPYDMFWIALTSVLATIALDFAQCIADLDLEKGLNGLKFIWLYLLDCPELNPRFTLENECTVKVFKVLKFLVGCLNYYVQVRILFDIVK